MNHKVGRNEKCPCGSGKKYKKCCLMNEDVAKVIGEVMVKKAKKEQKLRQVGIYVNYVNPIIFQGKKCWAIRNKVYFRDSRNETFNDFCIFVLSLKLGPDWFIQMRAKKLEDLNFLEKAFTEYENFRNVAQSKGVQVREGVFAVKPSGYVKSLSALAFDIATLEHMSDIPDGLIERLKNPNGYQGVRYEIMIAGIMARLGFNINWINDPTAKHCEFIAEHQNSRTKVGVEAKSRHRLGVLNQKGVVDEAKVRKGDVQGLLTKALKKQECGTVPYIIFIDVNSPLDNKEKMGEVQWVKDILDNARRKNEENSEKNKSDYNLIFFTNHSYHYDQENIAGNNEILSVAPQHVKFSLPDPSLQEGIQNALRWYGNVPDIDLED